MYVHTHDLWIEIKSVLVGCAGVYRINMDADSLIFNVLVHIGYLVHIHYGVVPTTPLSVASRRTHLTTSSFSSPQYLFVCVHPNREPMTIESVIGARDFRRILFAYRVRATSARTS
ncbi:hypothetical protein ABKN59_007275 [Abortiporus biennis]